MTEEKPKKFYSKLGCRECKRRKIKCDETKPLCQKCTRLYKECVYPKLGEKVLRVSKKFLTQNPEFNEQGKEFVQVNLAPGVVANGGERDPRAGSNSEAKGANKGLVGRNSSSGSSESPGDTRGISAGAVGGIMDPKLVPGAVPASHGRFATGRGTMAQPVQFQMQYNVDIPGQYNLGPGLAPGLAPGLTPGPVPVDTKLVPVPVAVPPPALAGPPPILAGPPPTLAGPPPSLSVNTPSLSGQPSSQKYKPTSSFILNSEKAPPSPVDFDMYFNKDDLNLLASDLNNLVGSIMVDSNYEYAELESLDSLTLAATSSTTPYGDLEDAIPRNLSFSIIKCSESEKYYLERFYKEFASIILPFNPYDETIGYFNPARDIIIYCASKEPFLLAAILAQGAKMTFNATKIPKHEEAYCHYLSKCLKLLGPAINNVPVRNKATASKNLASNIESVLLTVLLLTSTNASNSKQNWRPHLKGAKDLLTKHAAHSDLKSSKILIYCKVWYNSFELLAGLSSKKGGTLTTEHEIDLIMRQDDPELVRSLMEIGLVSPAGFNYMTGFHHQMLPTVTRLIKFVIKARKGVFNAFDNIRLLSELYEWSKFRFIHEKMVIPGTYIPPHGCLVEKCKDGFINWIDLSHTLYCLAGIVTVLTEGFGLSHDDKQVSPITKQLIDNIEFIRDGAIEMKDKLLMIQWPMLVAGTNCYEESQKNLVQKFFRISGSGSATFLINLIEKVWNRRQGGTDDLDLDIDTVTY